MWRWKNLIIFLCGERSHGGCLGHIFGAQGFCIFAITVIILLWPSKTSWPNSMPFQRYYVKCMISWINLWIHRFILLCFLIFLKGLIFSVLQPFSNKYLHHSVSCGVFSYNIKVTILNSIFIKNLNLARGHWSWHAIRIYTTNSAPIEIACKMGVRRSLLTDWFSTAIFLKFRIFLIILVEQIWTLKVLRIWPLKLDNKCNAHTGDEIQWNVARRCTLKNPQNHTK